MSEGAGSDERKADKTWIERIIVTTGQITLLIGALAALLSQIPDITDKWKAAKCAVFRCQGPAASEDHATATLPTSGASSIRPELTAPAPPTLVPAAKSAGSPVVSPPGESAEARSSLQPATKPSARTQAASTPLPEPRVCSDVSRYRVRQGNFTYVTNFLDVRDGDEIIGIQRSRRPLNGLSMTFQSRGSPALTHKSTRSFSPWDPKMDPDGSQCALIYIDGGKYEPTYAYKAALTIDTSVPASTFDVVLFQGATGSGIDVRKR